MQAPFFRTLGFDLAAFYSGTLNVSIAPFSYIVRKPASTFRQVKWHPTEPAEDFSFFDVDLLRRGRESVSGKIYYPHPETKPAHFQAPSVLELLLPWIDGVGYGDEVTLRVPSGQMDFARRRDVSGQGE